MPSAYAGILLVALAVMLPVFEGSLHAQSSASRRDADIRTMLAEAAGFQLAGKYKPALARYEAAYGRARSRVSAKALLGRILFGAGQCQERLARYDKALERYLQAAEPGRKGPYGDDALLRAGQVAELRMESFSRARALYKRLQSEHPSSPLTGLAALYGARTLEQEGRFDEALQAYEKLALVGAGRKEYQVVVARALEAARFIRLNGGEDYEPLKAYRRCERLARREKTRNAALLELIRLTGRYNDSPLVDDALVLMIRIHLAKGEQRAARETFGRLVDLEATSLSVEAARSIAVRAAGWLISDIDQEIARVAEVFPELAAYGRGESGWPVPGMVTRNSDGRWTLAFTNGGSALSPRHLKLRIIVGPAGEGKSAVYPALGLYQEVRIETANEVLSAELKRMIAKMAGALSTLDRAAYVRSEVEKAGQGN